MEASREQAAELVDHPARHGSGNGFDAEAAGTFELTGLLHVLQAMRMGDFSVRLPANCTGLEGKICDAFNDIVATNERMAEELELVGEVVGREGKTRTRVKLGLTEGAWRD